MQVYIKVHDMERSIAFYEQLTGTKASYSERKRWVNFPCGISLYSLAYDINKIQSGECSSENYNEAYINFVLSEQTRASKNIVFNFYTDDLKAERERIAALGIGKISEMMYVNIVMPYWFFIVEDPDGNEIEITGPYHET